MVNLYFEQFEDEDADAYSYEYEESFDYDDEPYWFEDSDEDYDECGCCCCTGDCYTDYDDYEYQQDLAEGYMSDLYDSVDG